MDKKKIFEILKNEILDLEIKDCESNIIVDRIAELADRLYEQLEEETAIPQF